MCIRDSDEAERFKHQDKEFHELAPQREALIASLQKLNAEIEALSAGKASLERLEEELTRSIDKREALLEEEQALVAEHRLHERAIDPSLASIAPAEEHSLRDRIDSLVEERRKCQHSVDLAKENYLSLIHIYRDGPYRIDAARFACCGASAR